MDHFNITHICVHCLKETKVFKVELSWFSDQGKLIIESKEKDERFNFMKALDKLYIIFNNITV